MSKIPYEAMTSDKLRECTLEHLRNAYVHFCSYPSTSTRFRFKDEVAREIRNRELTALEPHIRASIMLPLPLIDALKPALREELALPRAGREQQVYGLLDVFEETLAQLNMKVVSK